jgi:hypothetical protein
MIDPYRFDKNRLAIADWGERGDLSVWFTIGHLLHSNAQSPYSGWALAFGPIQSWLRISRGVILK